MFRTKLLPKFISKKLNIYQLLSFLNKKFSFPLLNFDMRQLKHVVLHRLKTLKRVNIISLPESLKKKMLQKTLTSN